MSQFRLTILYTVFNYINSLESSEGFIRMNTGTVTGMLILNFLFVILIFNHEITRKKAIICFLSVS